jgi:cyclase
MVLACLLLALGCFLCTAGSAKESPDLTKLGEGVFVRMVSPDSAAVSNSGVVVLDHSVLVFDTHFTPEAGQELLAGIRSITSKPVRFVVNSHSHADHTHGNQAFADAQLIGSTNARRDMLQVDVPSLNRAIEITKTQLVKLRQEMAKETGATQIKLLRDQIKSREDYLQTMSALKIMAPFVTLDDSLTLQDGKQEVRIAFLGTGHTEGDIVLYLPSQKIAFVGDLFFSEAIPNVQDASILQWMKTLQEVLKLDADKFVPGHGPVGSKKDVQGFLKYFEELRSAVQAGIARDESVEQVTGEIPMPAKYSSYRFTNFFPSNVQKMYAELKAQQIASESGERSSKKDAGAPQK